MNKKKPTIERIKWTTVALNFFTDIQQSIDNLVISKKDQPNSFVKGTDNDIMKINNYITTKLGATTRRLLVRREFDPAYWYQQAVEKDITTRIPSDLMEICFAEVPGWHKKHAEVWDATTDNDEDLRDNAEENEVDDDDVTNNYL